MNTAIYQMFRRVTWNTLLKEFRLRDISTIRTEFGQIHIYIYIKFYSFVQL